MYCSLAFVILVAFVLNSYADTISENTLDPDAPGLCSYNGEYYPPGEHLLPECKRLICSPKGWASVHSCKESSTLKNCFRGKLIDAKQPFPQCCKKNYICRRPDGSLFDITSF